MTNCFAQADTIQHGEIQQKGVRNNQPLLLGIENTQDPIWRTLAGKNIGLITNQTGVTQAKERTIDVLLKRKFAIKKIFAPEHGINGVIAAEKSVGDTVDAATRIPILSLYGHGSGKKIGAHMLHDLDVLIFDMQDCGMRHFTYISTLLHVMEAAAHNNKQVIVLDRPNPLGGSMEGPLTLVDHASFIAAAPIPLRYGMTIGELAQFFNMHVLKKQAQLSVVPMSNFSRTTNFKLDLPPLSPFVKDHAACIGYSFLGLLGEVRPFDTGLETEKALRVVALPADVPFCASQWRTLAVQLKQHGVTSNTVTYYSPRKKKYCHGLEIAVADSNSLQSFQILLTVLKTVHDAGVPLIFSKHFDVAVGSRLVHQYVKGVATKAQLAAEVNSGLQAFTLKAQRCYLYAQAPTISSMI